MRRRLAAVLLLVTGLPAVAVPPAVPFLPPEFIEALPQPEPTLTDPAKLAERIEANAKAAAAKLADRDPCADARKAQQQALRDIDELLKLAENPPPPPMGGDGSPPPPMGGESDPGGQPPPGGSGAGKPPPPGGGKKPGGQPPPGGKSGPKQPGGGQPQPGGTPMPGDGGPPMPAGPGDQPAGAQAAGANPGNGGAKAKPAPPLDDRIAKQVWGHLPDTVRKQMSQYYQEQFMPRYGGLLRDYFSALAERERQSPARRP